MRLVSGRVRVRWGAKQPLPGEWVVLILLAAAHGECARRGREWERVQEGSPARDELTALKNEKTG